MSHRIDSESSNLFQWRGLTFNALFILYAFFLHPGISNRMDDVMRLRQEWPAMAIALAVLSLLDGVLLPIKIRRIFRKTGSTLTANQTAIWFMLPLIFRTLVGLIVAVSVFSLLVPDIRYKPPWSPVAAGLAVILIVKELLTIMNVLFLLMKNTARTCAPLTEWLADLNVLVMSCVIFTLITRPGFFFTTRQMAEPFMFPLIAFCFFAYLLSLRLTFTLEEFLMAPSLKDKLLIWFSLLAAAVSASWAVH
ncbi:hypothetical protein JW823_09030 [bacterium]|nr:hypothetical protein [candidate division CSSED10-310 bacterium]